MVDIHTNRNVVLLQNENLNLSNMEVQSYIFCRLHVIWIELNK